MFNKTSTIIKRILLLVFIIICYFEKSVYSKLSAISSLMSGGRLSTDRSGYTEDTRVR
jgi:hypothetical protein